MKNSIRRFKKRFKNANAAVKQIRAGEWQFPVRYGRCFTAEKDGLEIWVANGPLFCDTDPASFGFLFRHYVWWMAAGSAIRQVEAELRKSKKNNIPTLY